MGHTQEGRRIAPGAQEPHASADAEGRCPSRELRRHRAVAEEREMHLGIPEGGEDLEAYARRTLRNYFHPAGTCGIGRVVDTGGRVLGIECLVVADASVMPTIPRANTNLTTVAIAERLAETI